MAERPEADAADGLPHALSRRWDVETRGAEPQQQALRRTFLSKIEFPEQARVLEVGCGTGVLTRQLARWPGVGSVLGVDAAYLLSRGRELAANLSNVSFDEADARSLPFEDGAFDVVVFDSTLSHVPGPERASPKQSGCCAQRAGSRPSTATTRPRRSRSAITTPCKLPAAARFAPTTHPRDHPRLRPHRHPLPP